MIDSPKYLVWSNEHRMWSAPARYGYVESFLQAGQYTREEAVAIASVAVPNLLFPHAIMPEIPVALADVLEMQKQMNLAFPGRPKAAWE